MGIQSLLALITIFISLSLFQIFYFSIDSKERKEGRRGEEKEREREVPLANE